MTSGIPLVFLFPTHNYYAYFPLSGSHSFSFFFPASIAPVTFSPLLRFSFLQYVTASVIHVELFPPSIRKAVQLCIFPLLWSIYCYFFSFFSAFLDLYELTALPGLWLNFPLSSSHSCYSLSSLLSRLSPLLSLLLRFLPSLLCYILTLLFAP